MAWLFSAGEVLTAANLNAVTLPWNAMCQLRMSAAQSIASNTVTILSFDTEDLDDRGWHTGGSPTRITPTIAGHYRTTVSITWNGDTDYTRTQCILFKNGATSGMMWNYDADGTNVGAANVGSFPLVYCNGSTDYLELQAFQTNTNAGANTAATVWLVEFVRS